ncbi:MAG: hypothetical protein LBI17_01145 [Rickettsiales bacterium]|jgi:hypothetical protein|nr:hypothetical protein [Rickettsiales bacterium]
MERFGKSCVLLVAVACVAAEVFAAPARPKVKRRQAVASPAPVEEAKSEPEPESAPAEPVIPPREAFANCMENMCLDAVYGERGRCKCSGEIARIEKVLATIDDLQSKADDESAALESLLKGEKEEAKSTSDMMASLAGEVKTAGGIAAAVQSFRLGENAFEKCSELAPDAPKEERGKWLKLYMNKVDADCVSYSTILKERTDGLLSFYLQVKKNREIFDRQELDKVDQLDEGTCYLEYEACAKDDCGAGFKGCKEELKLRAMLQKCQAINRGKCESSKMKVIGDLLDFIRKELR